MQLDVCHLNGKYLLKTDWEIAAPEHSQYFVKLSSDLTNVLTFW